MPTPKPATIANELFDKLADVIAFGRVMDAGSPDYFDMRRKVRDLEHVSASEGLVARAAMYAVSGNPQAFLPIAADVLRAGSDLDRLYLVGYALVLGERPFARRLLAAVDMDSPDEYTRKISLSVGLLDIRAMERAIAAAQAAGLDLSGLWSHIVSGSGLGAFMNRAQREGYTTAVLDLMQDVAAKAAIRAGILLSLPGVFRFDDQDGDLALSFDLPVGLEKAFEIERHIDEISEGIVDFPHTRAVIAIHARDAAPESSPERSYDDVTA